MNARLQRRIQRYGWNKAVSSYERFWKQQLASAQTRLLAMAALQPGERVLDVACGTGIVAFRAANLVGTTGAVVGTDIAEQMVETACRRANDQRLGQVAFARMDAEEILFPDALFDAVLCALGLMYVPDPLRALHEMHRVLRPGGRAVAAVWGQRQHCGWAEIFPIVEERVLSDVCPLFFQLGTGEVLGEMLQTAGFSDVVSERLLTVLYYDSAEEACGAAFAGGPVALAYAHFDASTRQEAHTAYLAAIEPYRRGSGYAIPGEFVIASGRKLGTMPALTAGGAARGVGRRAG
jgi:ubiquinone/menaquinone biosynthesis C-methylase UbiE